MTLLGTLFGFSGRINRSTFWLCAIALLLLDVAVLISVQDWARQAASAATSVDSRLLGVGLPVLALALVSLWCGLALKVKRLHDRGRSGLWLLAGLIPVVGGLWLFWEIGLAPGRAKGRRFERDGADEPAEEPASDSWLGVLAPAAAIGAAGAAAVAVAENPATAAPAPELAPDSGYGVIEPAPEAAEPVSEPAPEQEPASAAAQAEAAEVTRSQIADYLADAGAPLEPDPEPEPVAAHEPVAEAPRTEIVEADPGEEQARTDPPADAPSA